MANPITPFAAAGDGLVRRYGTTWSTIRSSSTGDDVNATGTGDYGVWAEHTNPGIGRSFYPFDTSSLDDTAVATAASLFVYVTAASASAGGSFVVVASTQASTSTLTTADYSAVGTTELSSRVNFSGLATGAYLEIPLNAAGRAAINTTGYTKLALRSSFDLDNSAPSGATSQMQVRFSEFASTTSDPYLSVTWALARTTSDSWAWSDRADPSWDTATAHGRSVGERWAWSDTAAWQGIPAARTAIGSEVTVFATNGVASTFGAHYGFSDTKALADGKTLMCVACKGDQHASRNTTLVYKTSTDDGATWSSETTIIDERSTNSTGWRDPYLTVLASGRIAITAGRPSTVSTVDTAKPPFIYSDDNGATWSTPVLLDSTACGVYTGDDGTNWGFCYGSDIVELANGDLLLFGYGPTDATHPANYDLFCSKSTDDGATWTALSKPSTYAAYTLGVVEPQAELMPNGDIYVTFHTQDTLPTDWYRVRSQNSGATWGTPVLVSSGETENRQGLTVMSDGRVIVSSNQIPPSTFRYVAYQESWNGAQFGPAVTVAAYLVGGASLGSLLWCMATALGGSGVSQNVGFTYSAENGAQTKASVFYRQFTGIDGTAVYRRAATDAWAWSDAAARQVTRPRTAGDAWAWSDTATRSTQTLTRATSDTWAWTDTALQGGGATYSRTTSDAWAWSDAAAQSTSGPAARTTADAWAWSDALARALATPRTTSDLWRWSEPRTTTAPLFWLTARRRSSMSAPTKTYKVVQPAGTAKTATWTSDTYVAQTEAGILVVLDVTAASGTGGLTLRINAHDQASSRAVALNSAPTAVTATGTTSYALYPFGAVSGNVTQATEFYLPRMFSISVTHGDSSSYTYSVGYCLLP